MVLALTIAVAALGAGAVWLLTPARGLVVYLAVLCLYPQYMAISTGTLDWTTSRIVGLSLLLRIVTYRASPPDYRLIWMDILIVADFAGDTIAHFMTGPTATVFERESGQFLTEVVPYFLVRYSLRSREDVFRVFRAITIIAVPLAIVGIFHSLTGSNPYAFLREHSPWSIGPQRVDVRYGMYRADGPFGDKISFGLFFAMALALQIGLLFADRQRIINWVTRAGAICVGIFSAMSTAPIFAAVASLSWVGVRPFRRWLPYVFGGFLAFILLIELYSDRHFYHVLTRLAMDSRNAYYRIELIEEAFGGGMDGHWIAGYGYVGVGPGTDNTNFHWRRKDFVNIYIGRLATGGLLSLLPFVALNIYYYFALYKAHRLARDFPSHWMIWCFTAGLIGWNVAMMTVGAMQQIQVLYAMLLGVIAGWLRLLAHQEADQTEPVIQALSVPPISPVRGPQESLRGQRESLFKRFL